MVRMAEQVTNWKELGVLHCTRCNLKTSDAGLFQAHNCRPVVQQRSRASLMYRPQYESYLCSLCNIDVPEKVIVEHLENHVSLKPYQCKYCQAPCDLQTKFLHNCREPNKEFQLIISDKTKDLILKARQNPDKMEFYMPLNVTVKGHLLTNSNSRPPTIATQAQNAALNLKVSRTLQDLHSNLVQATNPQYTKVQYLMTHPIETAPVPPPTVSPLFPLVPVVSPLGTQMNSNVHSFPSCVISPAHGHVLAHSTVNNHPSPALTNSSEIYSWHRPAACAPEEIPRNPEKSVPPDSDPLNTCVTVKTQLGEDIYHEPQNVIASSTTNVNNTRKENLSETSTTNVNNTRKENLSETSTTNVNNTRKENLSEKMETLATFPSSSLNENSGEVETDDYSYLYAIKGYYLCLKCKNKWWEHNSFFLHIWQHHIHTSDLLTCCPRGYSLKCKRLIAVLKSVFSQFQQPVPDILKNHFQIVPETTNNSDSVVETSIRNSNTDLVVSNGQSSESAETSVLNNSNCDLVESNGKNENIISTNPSNTRTTRTSIQNSNIQNSNTDLVVSNGQSSELAEVQNNNTDLVESNGKNKNTIISTNPSSTRTTKTSIQNSNTDLVVSKGQSSELAEVQNNNTDLVESNGKNKNTIISTNPSSTRTTRTSIQNSNTDLVVSKGQSSELAEVQNNNTDLVESNSKSKNTIISANPSSTRTSRTSIDRNDRYSTDSMEYLDSETKSSEIKSYYQCGFQNCNYASMRPVDFLHHIEEAHGSETSFSCNYCGYVGASSSSLLDHLGEHIGTEDAYVFSGSIISDNEEYDYQSKDIHSIIGKFEEQLKNPKATRFTILCKICQSKFFSLLEFREHLINSLLKVISCKNCRSYFLDAGSWAKHRAKEHPNEPRLYCINRKLLCDALKLYNQGVPLYKPNFKSKNRSDEQTVSPATLQTDKESDKEIVTQQTSSDKESDKEIVSKQTSSDKESDKEIVSKQTSSDKESDKESDKDIVSKQTSSDKESDKEIVSKQTSSDKESDKEIVSKQTSSDKESDIEIVSKQTSSDNEIVSKQTSSDKESDKEIVSKQVSKQTSSDKESDKEIVSKQVSKQTSSDKESDKEIVSKQTSSADIQRTSSPTANELITFPPAIVENLQSQSNKQLVLTGININCSDEVNRSTKKDDLVTTHPSISQTLPLENNCNGPKCYTPDIVGKSCQMEKLKDICGKQKTDEFLKAFYESTGDNNFCCTKCKRKTLSLKRIHAHVFNCIGKMGVSYCPYCFYEAEHSQLIVRHMEKEHPDKKSNVVFYLSVNTFEFMKALQSSSVNSRPFADTCAEFKCMEAYYKKLQQLRSRTENLSELLKMWVPGEDSGSVVDSTTCENATPFSDASEENLQITLTSERKDVVIEESITKQNELTHSSTKENIQSEKQSNIKKATKRKCNFTEDIANEKKLRPGLPELSKSLVDSTTSENVCEVTASPLFSTEIKTPTKRKLSSSENHLRPSSSSKISSNDNSTSHSKSTVPVVTNTAHTKDHGVKRTGLKAGIKHVALQQYKCNKCNYICKWNESSMVEHFRTTHPYKACGYCDAVYFTKVELEEHCNFVHVGKKICLSDAISAKDVFTLVATKSNSKRKNKDENLDGGDKMDNQENKNTKSVNEHVPTTAVKNSTQSNSSVALSTQIDRQTPEKLTTTDANIKKADLSVITTAVKNSVKSNSSVTLPTQHDRQTPGKHTTEDANVKKADSSVCPFKCSVCGSYQKCIAGIVDHFRWLHAQEVVQFMDRKHRTVYTLQENTLTCKPGSTVPLTKHFCYFCSFRHQLRSEVESHILADHSGCHLKVLSLDLPEEKVDTEEDDTSDTDTGNVFKTRSNTRVAAKPNPVTKYNCPLCDDHQSSLFAFRLHLAIKHEGFRPITTLSSTAIAGLLMCHVCGHIANNQRGLGEHMAWHMQERQFICSKCTFDSHTKKGVLGHINLFHVDDPNAKVINRNIHANPLRPQLVGLDPLVALRNCLSCENADYLRNLLVKHDIKLLDVEGEDICENILQNQNKNKLFFDVRTIKNN